jgi:hypothetical protein
LIPAAILDVRISPLSNFLSLSFILPHMERGTPPEKFVDFPFTLQLLYTINSRIVCLYIFSGAR